MVYPRARAGGRWCPAVGPNHVLTRLRGTLGGSLETVWMGLHAFLRQRAFHPRDASVPPLGLASSTAQPHTAFRIPLPRFDF